MVVIEKRDVALFALAAKGIQRFQHAGETGLTRPVLLGQIGHSDAAALKLFVVIQNGLHVVPDLLEGHMAAHGLQAGVLEQLAYLLGGFFKKSRKFHALVAHAGKLVQNALQVVAGVLTR